MIMQNVAAFAGMLVVTFCICYIVAPIFIGNFAAISVFYRHNVADNGKFIGVLSARRCERGDSNVVSGLTGV